MNAINLSKTFLVKSLIPVYCIHVVGFIIFMFKYFLVIIISVCFHTKTRKYLKKIIPKLSFKLKELSQLSLLSLLIKMQLKLNKDFEIK